MRCWEAELEESKKTKLKETEYRLVVARGWEWGMGEMGEGGQKVQTFSCKIKKFWDYNVQRSDYS